jgi:hypothetical protein
MRTKIFLSSLIGAIFFIAGCSNHSSNDSYPEKINTSQNQRTTPADKSDVPNTTKVSGKVIDGYVKNARIKIASIIGTALPTIYVNGLAPQSKSDGSFTVYLDTDNKELNKTSSAVIKSSGGTDTMTNTDFEGVLENVVTIDENTRSAREVGTKEPVLTPLTTLVAKKVVSSAKDGTNIDAATIKSTLSTAKKEIVKKVIGKDVSTDILDQDIIAKMKEGDTTAAEAWKKGLVVQKNC